MIRLLIPNKSAVRGDILPVLTVPNGSGSAIRTASISHGSLNDHCIKTDNEKRKMIKATSWYVFPVLTPFLLIKIMTEERRKNDKEVDGAIGSPNTHPSKPAAARRITETGRRFSLSLRSFIDFIPGISGYNCRSLFRYRKGYGFSSSIKSSIVLKHVPSPNLACTVCHSADLWPAQVEKPAVVFWQIEPDAL
jgi:hypothetical protein